MDELQKLAIENIPQDEFFDNRPNYEIKLELNNVALVIGRFGIRYAFYVSKTYPKTYLGMVGSWDSKDTPLIKDLIKWIKQNA